MNAPAAAPPRWPLWPALIGAPLLVLTDLGIAYALVTPLCAHQRGEWVHALTLAFVVLTALTTVIAALGMRAALAADDNRRFVARVATGSGALSTLVLLAMWIPPWWLSPCAA